MVLDENSRRGDVPQTRTDRAHLVNDLAVTHDPIVPLLDEVVDERAARVATNNAPARVLTTLTTTPGLIAWEWVPQETFRPTPPIIDPLALDFRGWP